MVVNLHAVDPLDVACATDAWQHRTDRCAVMGRQRFAVHSSRQQCSVAGVQEAQQRCGRRVPVGAGVLCCVVGVCVRCFPRRTQPLDRLCSRRADTHTKHARTHTRTHAPIQAYEMDMQTRQFGLRGGLQPRKQGRENICESVACPLGVPHHPHVNVFIPATPQSTAW